MSTKSKGHSEHTQAADQPTGFDGQFSRPIKITMLGAGSAFTPRLMNDIFSIGGADRGEIALVDIDAERLVTMHKLIKRLAGQHGKRKWKVTATADRGEALPGSHYVISCIEVSGPQCVALDNDIPLSFGIDQCIGDTMGPGGLFKGLRTIPVWLKILADCERHCPEATVMNYTNPMAMLCVASARTSSVPVLGLCHSVQGTSHLLAKRAGIPYAELDWACAGINHLAWFTRLQHDGKDLYPMLKKKAVEDLARAAKEGRPPADEADVPEWQKDLVRKDMMLQFGAFITESSGHLSEYLPYYRTSIGTLERYARAGYDGESGFYARRWPEWRKAQDADRGKMLRGKMKMEWDRSWEYPSWIIEAREKDVAFRMHGNVMNNHGGAGPLIGNLPHDGCVEVACLIDGNGVQPTVFGNLPPQMAAVSRSNMGFTELGAIAAMERSKEAAIHALMLDPLTSAVLPPARIRELALKMFTAEKVFLPGFR